MLPLNQPIIAVHSSNDVHCMVADIPPECQEGKRGRGQGHVAP